MEESIALKRKYIFFFAISFICLYVFGKVGFNYLRMDKWKNEIRPYTDNFLDLLSQKNYEILYKNYAGNCGVNFTDFFANLQLLYNKIGAIKSYKYSGMSSSANGQFNDINVFFVYYKLIANDNKIYNVAFQIDIHSNDNQLNVRQISRFSIEQNFGIDSYSLLLNSKSLGNKKKMLPRTPG